MDMLLSIRWEWSLGIKRRYSDTLGTYWGIGIFLGPITLVLTNMRLLENRPVAKEAQEHSVDGGDDNG